LPHNIFEIHIVSLNTAVRTSNISRAMHNHTTQHYKEHKTNLNIMLI